MTDSEDDLLYSFEKLFLFEFYVRNLQLNQSREFENLLQLKVNIQEKFADVLDLDKNSLIIKDLVYFVLDSLQFDYDLSLVQTELDAWNISDKQLAQIIDVCKKFENTPKINLANRFYRFSDLVYSNDILEVMSWWGEILNKETRDKYKLEGTFGIIGKVPSGSIMSDFSELDFPRNDMKMNDTVKPIYLFSFNCPDVIGIKRDNPSKRDNYCIFNSNDDVVTIINENRLNSLVLSISIDKPADNIDSILEEFRREFCLLQHMRNWEEISAVMDPTTEARASLPYVTLLEVPDEKDIKPKSIIKGKSKCNKLIKKYTSINKWLIGLYCYDVSFENKNLDDSAKSVISKLEEFKLHEAFNRKTGKQYNKKYNQETILQYYDDVKSKIDQASVL